MDNSQIEQIVKLQTTSVAALLKESDITLEVSETAVQFIAQAGFDPEFGARPIKRAIQRYLLNDLSKQLLAGAIDKNKPIKVDAHDGILTFSN